MYNRVLLQSNNILASMVRALFSVVDSLRRNTFASTRSAVCTWRTLDLSTATAILVVDFDTHLGRICGSGILWLGGEKTEM